MTESGAPERGALAAKPFHLDFKLQLAALGIWIAAWIAAQGQLVHWGFSAKQQVAAFSALAAAIYGVAFIARRAGFFELLTSVPFAVSQMLFMAAAGGLGTLVPQDEPTDFYGQHYGPFARRFIFLLRSEDLFHSLWFYALLSLLALSMLAVAWKRRPYPAHRMGFLLVHVSTSIILLGCLWGAFGQVRAFNELRAGQPAEVFYQMKHRRPDYGEPYKLPGFRIQLNRTTAERPAPEYKLYAFVQPDGQGGFEKNPKAYEAKQGMKAKLPLSRLHFSVEQIIPNALEAGEFIDNPDAPENPALRVMLGIGEPQPVVGDLFAHRESAARRDEPGGRFAVVYVDAWSDALLNQLRPRPPTAEKILLSSMGQVTEHDAKVGSAWAFQSSTLKVEKYYPDFAVEKDKEGNPHAYTRSLRAVEPWLELSLRQPGAPPRRVMLSARNPGLSDQLNGPNLPIGLQLKYVREGEEGQSRFVVFTRQDHSVRLIENGKVARSEPFQFNKPFIIQKGLSATAVAAMDHADFIPAFVPHPDPKEAVKFDHPVMKVKLWDPDSGKSEEKWLDTSSPEGPPKLEAFFDRSVGLSYKAKAGDSPDFHSELVVLDATGKVLAKKTVGTHEPLVFHGYEIFQSNNAPVDSAGGAIMVVREPGQWLVHLGFLCLIVGIAWMFYLKPVLKGRGASKKEA